jgi:hypothetical protein
VTDASHAFVPGWREAILGTDLQQIWLDHLLVLSMRQCRSSKKRWSWGRSVLVYPREDPSFASAAARYATLLKDRTTFEARTLEDLLAAPGALHPGIIRAIRERYL